MIEETKEAALVSVAAKQAVTTQVKKFTYRLVDPYMPIKKQQNRHFPAIDKLDYENYLVAINEISCF